MRKMIRLRFLPLIPVCVWLVGCSSAASRPRVEEPVVPVTGKQEVEPPTNDAPTIFSIYDKSVRLPEGVKSEVSSRGRSNEAGWIWRSAAPAEETTAVAVASGGRTVGKMYQNIEDSGKAFFKMDAFLELGRDKVFAESRSGRGKELAILLRELPGGSGAKEDAAPPAFHAMLSILRTLTCLEEAAKTGKLRNDGPGSPFPDGVVPPETLRRWKTEGVYVRRGIDSGAENLELKRIPGGRYQGTWSVMNWRELPDLNAPVPAETKP